MSLAKVHLVDSDVPLKEGSDMVALCYKAIPKAAFAFMWSDEMGHWDIHLSGCCRKCVPLAMEAGPGKRYLYGIIPRRGIVTRGLCRVASSGRMAGSGWLAYSPPKEIINGNSTRNVRSC